MISHWRIIKAMAKLKPIWQFDSEEAKVIEYVVHKITVNDVDDPDVYVGQPIHDWQQTEAGKWVLENSRPKPCWYRYNDTLSYGYVYYIKAYFTPQQLTYWKLKYE